MIRTFAWCGTYTSTSSIVRPHSASTASAELTRTRVANLNTSRPFIFTKCCFSATDSAAVHLPEVRFPGHGPRGRGRRGPAGRQVELRPAGAIGAELEAEEAALGD